MHRLATRKRLVRTLATAAATLGLLAVLAAPASAAVVRYAESWTMTKGGQWHTSGAHNISGNRYELPNWAGMVVLKIWQVYPSNGAKTRLNQSNGQPYVAISGPALNTYAYCRWDDGGGYGFGFCDRTSP